MIIFSVFKLNKFEISSNFALVCDLQIFEDQKYIYS